MEKLDFSYSAGVVLNVNTLTESVKYLDDAGNTKEINLVGEVTAKLDGSELTDISAVKKDMKINVVYSNDKLYAIEFASVISDSVYQGIYMGNVKSSSGNKIKYKEAITDTSTLEIPLAEKCTITCNNKATALEDLPKENVVGGFMSSGDFNGLTKEDLVMLF